jgi:hypothetical protein
LSISNFKLELKFVEEEDPLTGDPKGIRIINITHATDI